MIKKIHQIWFQGERNAPQNLQGFSRKWKTLNPSYQHKVWEKTAMDAFISKHYPNYYSRYRELPHMIQKIDFFKYAVLNIEGGFYIDMDVECLLPLELPDKYITSDFSPSTAPFYKYENLLLSGQKDLYNNAVIYSRKNSPILKKLINRSFLYNCKNKNKTQCVFMTTGPLIYSKIINKYRNKLNVVDFPSSYFEPVWTPKYNKIDTYLNRFNKKQIGKHHFNSDWVDVYWVETIVIYLNYIYIYLRYIIPITIIILMYYNPKRIAIFSLMYLSISMAINIYLKQILGI
tara:strand:- start:190 stop:1056 length:867 start_codon:yes stop_codon:yes gene_type:complete